MTFVAVAVALGADEAFELLVAGLRRCGGNALVEYARVGERDAWLQ